LQDNEGHPGFIVYQVQGAAEDVISKGIKPNLVLLNVGTNDCLGNADPDGAPSRLQNLINVCLNGMPNVVIIASTLLPNGAGAESCVEKVNTGYKSVVAGFNNPKVILADMHDGFITTGDLNSDGVHPNDYGYDKMASVWFDAFGKIVDLVSAPDDNGVPDDKRTNVCPKTYGFSDGHHQTQAGSGYDDGPYTHTGVKRPTVTLTQTQGLFGNGQTSDGSDPLNSIFFAQLVNAGGAPRGGELDELIFIEYSDAGEYIYMYYVNQGNLAWDSGTHFTPPFNCKPTSKPLFPRKQCQASVSDRTSG
jgi:GDSL-like Lipase/Acylhydrolase family